MFRFRGSGGGSGHAEMTFEIWSVHGRICSVHARAWSGMVGHGRGQLVLSSKPCGFLLGRHLVGAWLGPGWGLVGAWSAPGPPARCMVRAWSGQLVLSSKPCGFLLGRPGQGRAGQSRAGQGRAGQGNAW